MFLLDTWLACYILFFLCLSQACKHFVQLILVNTVILILICSQTAVYYPIVTHICVMNYIELANSYFITMSSDSSISCHDFASFRVWQKSTRSRKCKAVFRPLLLGLYIVKKKKKTRAWTCHTLQTSLHNQPNSMQPNILLLVVFAEVNPRCSCSLVEDIKNKQ